MPEVESEPNNANAWFDLGMSYGELKRYADAIEANRRTLHINPKHVKAWNNLGVAYIHLERYGEATEAFRQTLHINPEFATARFNLGLLTNFPAIGQPLWMLSRNCEALIKMVGELFNLIVPR